MSDYDAAALARLAALLDGKPEHNFVGIARLRDAIDPDRHTEPPVGHVRCGRVRPINAWCTCPIAQARADAASAHDAALTARARAWQDGTRAGYAQGLRDALVDPDSAAELVALLDATPRTDPTPNGDTP